MDYFVLVESAPNINKHCVLCVDDDGQINLVNGDCLAVSVESDGTALINIITEDIGGALDYLIEKKMIKEYRLI